MKMTELFLADLDRETAGTRKALERVPEGRNDWKPHEKSMPLGYLAALVAVLPSWIEMMVDQDSHDAAEASRYDPKAQPSSGSLVALFERSLDAGRGALLRTTDEHLLKPWQFKYQGQVLVERPRHVMIRDAAISHLAHHRGQLTVYLRLSGRPVPSIYGPSADER